MNVAARLRRIQEKMNHEGFKDRLGECYSNAGRYVVDNPGAILVHGSIELVGDPIDHAWAVYPTVNTRPEWWDVYEPTTGVSWTYSEFTEVFGAKERVRYTRDEFLAVLLSVCHWGPYDPEAKAGANHYDMAAVREAQAIAVYNAVEEQREELA